MSKKASWFEIYVDDIQRATTFYEFVLNTKLEHMGDPSDQNTIMMAFPNHMNSYGSGGALIKMEGFKTGGNSTIIYFYSKDCLSEQTRVVEAGGQIIKPKMSIGEFGFISICIDTEGNMFGLHSMQ